MTVKGKDREKVTTNGRAVFYTIFWENFRKAALDRGYSLALHGSMASDMDMVLIPWVEEPQPVEEVIKAFSDNIGGTVFKECHLEPHPGKPHGRIVYTLSIYRDFYIDISYLPIDRMTKLISTQDEYNKLLSDEISELVGVAKVHGWKSQRHDAGQSLRERINNIKNSVGI